MKKLNLDHIDKMTGEIIEGRPECPFRTSTDLKCYNDDEREFGPSVVDDEGYEDINDIIKRILRLPKGKGQQLLDALAADVVDGDITDAEAEAMLDDNTPDLSNISDLTQLSEAVDYLAAQAVNNNRPEQASVPDQADKTSAASADTADV